jgi:hypothetical protein
VRDSGRSVAVARERCLTVFLCVWIGQQARSGNGGGETAALPPSPLFLSSSFVSIPSHLLWEPFQEVIGPQWTALTLSQRSTRASTLPSTSTSHTIGNRSCEQCTGRAETEQEDVSSLCDAE